MLKILIKRKFNVNKNTKINGTGTDIPNGKDSFAKRDTKRERVRIPRNSVTLQFAAVRPISRGRGSNWLTSSSPFRVETWHAVSVEESYPL